LNNLHIALHGRYSKVFAEDDLEYGHALELPTFQFNVYVNINNTSVLKKKASAILRCKAKYNNILQ